MTHIRVLRVVASLDLEVGGPAESSVNACIAAQRAGVDNTLAVLVPERARDNTADIRNRLAEEGVPLRVFVPRPSASYYGARWAVSPALAGWLGRFAGRYDLVHIHGAWGLSQLAGLLASRMHRLPCVMSPHEALTKFDIQGDDVNRLRPVVKRAMKWLYLRNLSLIVFSSPLEARDSLPEQELTRATVIAHPLRDAFDVPITNLGGRGHLRIGFLGRLHEKKNIDILIRAVQAGTTSARLLIAGDGPAGYKAELERVAVEVGMDDRIDWMGFVQGNEKWDFIDGLDVLAMPSRYECFGLVAAEALARGTPPVVSDRTGVADLIKRSGVGAVSAPTVDALAEVFRSFEADPPILTRRGTAAGPALARHELSLAAYGRSIRREYEMLCDDT